ncbi:MAG: class IV adenylate cyclase [Pirellulales bacterium]|nr:class IV adenylate cyclase [Pirellulales bacterium]
MTMKYEVEQKFPVPDLADIETALAGLGVEILGVKIEVDRYFNHPARDFGETDEAFRLRRTETGSGEPTNRITYKGPKVDQTTKTRKELDLPLPDGKETFEAFAGLLETLGFVPVGEVHKERRKAHVEWEGRTVEVSLDLIARLGTFVELELVVPPEELDAARATIASLAAHLSLTTSERRSYLNLLMDLDA